MLLLGLYVLLLGRSIVRVRFSHFQKAAVLAILFVLIHSAVDYPLRAIGVAIPIVLFHAFVFHPEFSPANRRIAGLIDIDEGGQTRRVPVAAPAS